MPILNKAFILKQIKEAREKNKHIMLIVGRGNIQGLQHQEGIKMYCYLNPESVLIEDEAMPIFQEPSENEILLKGTLLELISDPDFAVLFDSVFIDAGVLSHLKREIRDNCEEVAAAAQDEFGVKFYKDGEKIVRFDRVEGDLFYDSREAKKLLVPFKRIINGLVGISKDMNLNLYISSLVKDANIDFQKYLKAKRIEQYIIKINDKNTSYELDDNKIALKNHLDRMKGKVYASDEMIFVCLLQDLLNRFPANVTMQLLSGVSFLPKEGVTALHPYLGHGASTFQTMLALEIKLFGQELFNIESAERILFSINAQRLMAPFAHCEIPLIITPLQASEPLDGEHEHRRTIVGPSPPPIKPAPIGIRRAKPSAEVEDLDIASSLSAEPSMKRSPE